MKIKSIHTITAAGIAASLAVISVGLRRRKFKGYGVPEKI